MTGRLPNKVLHIAPTPFFADRGCHIRIRGIVRGLNAHAIENIVCTYPIGREIADIDTVRCARIPGYTQTAAGPSGYKYLADLYLIWTVARTIRRFKPDLLHCHLHEGVLIGWFAKWLSFRPSLPLVFDMQGSLVGELDAHRYFAGKRRMRAVFEWLEKRIVKRAQFVVCSSAASATLVQSAFGVRSSLVIVARDGADIAVGRQKEHRALESNRGRATAVYAGGLTESKGVRELKQVFLSAHRRRLPVHFVVIGYPTDDLEAFVAEHNLQHMIRIEGQIPFDELGSHLSSATIALEPKASGSGEASGKLVNYMSAGLPIVCFDTDNNRDMLAGDGFLARPGDVESFVDSIEEALTDVENARAFVENNRRRVREVFSWDKTSRDIVAAYEQIL